MLGNDRSWHSVISKCSTGLILHRERRGWEETFSTVDALDLFVRGVQERQMEITSTGRPQRSCISLHMPHSVLRAASIRYDVARAMKKEKKLQKAERRLKRRRRSVSNEAQMPDPVSELLSSDKPDEGKSSSSASSSSCRADQPTEEHSSSSTVPVQGDLLRQKLLLEGLEGELPKDISFAVEQGYMPMANIVNIVQSVLPDGAGSIGKCFKITLQDCISEFLMLVTHLAAQRCSREGRRIMLAEDILWALDQAGLCQYRSALRLFLGKLREHLKKCKKTGKEMVESLEAPPEFLEIENDCSSLPFSTSIFPVMPMSPTDVMPITATVVPPDRAEERKPEPAAGKGNIGLAEATVQDAWLDDDDASDVSFIDIVEGELV